MQATLMALSLSVVLIAACASESEQPDLVAWSAPKIHSDQSGPASEEPVQTHVAALPGSGPAEPSARVEERVSLLRPTFEACVAEAAGVTADTQSCIETEFLFHRKRLDSELERRRLSLDETGRRRLLEDQARWSAQLDARCAWDADEEGQAQRLEANLCLLEATAQRASGLAEAHEAGKD